MHVQKENSLEDAKPAVDQPVEDERTRLLLDLFAVSPLKQEKWKQLTGMMDSRSRYACLDIGSDNGVISYLFRRDYPATWSSVDLIPETVEAIRAVVRERVYQMTPSSLPFDDGAFDCVIVVDMMEHVDDDQALAHELLRILAPEGTLILNVPHPKHGIWRRFKALIGQTDEAHGHVRAGYSRESLQALFGTAITVEQEQTYSRFFSDLVDTVVTAALTMLKGKRGQKGTVVTGNDLQKLKKSFKLYSLLAPFILCFAALDRCIPFLHGNMLIVRYRKVSQ